MPISDNGIRHATVLPSLSASWIDVLPPRRRSVTCAILDQAIRLRKGDGLMDLAVTTATGTNQTITMMAAHPGSRTTVIGFKAAFKTPRSALAVSSHRKDDLW
jgi:hypothetical protein